MEVSSVSLINSNFTLGFWFWFWFCFGFVIHLGVNFTGIFLYTNTRFAKYYIGTVCSEQR